VIWRHLQWMNFHSQQWCRRRVQAHPQKFWFVKNLWKSRQNAWKSGLICENLCKIPESLGKNSAQRCLISKHGVQRLQNDMKTFFWWSSQEMVFIVSLWEKCWHKTFLAKFWGNSGKNPAHPQKFACAYTCDSQRISVSNLWDLDLSTTLPHNCSVYHFIFFFDLLHLHLIRCQLLVHQLCWRLRYLDKTKRNKIMVLSQITATQLNSKNSRSSEEKPKNALKASDLGTKPWVWHHRPNHFESTKSVMQLIDQDKLM